MINKIKDCFIAEIREKETMSQTLGKYIPAFDYVDNTLLVLSTKCGSVFIALFSTVMLTPVVKTSASFVLV